MAQSDLADKLVDRMLNPDSTKLVQDVIDIEVEKARALASQDMTDAALDRRQLIEDSANCSTVGWDPKFKEYLRLNVEYVVEASKPRRRRR